MASPELNLVFFAFACCLRLWEFFFPMRELPKSNRWLLRAFGLSVFQLVVVYVGMAFLPRVGAAAFFDFSTYAGKWESLYAIAVISFVSYWQHRLKHRFDFLWNFFHQVHHSPVRIELLTSFYRNPLEILLNMFFLYVIMFSLLGFSTGAVLNCTVFLGMADLFYHANIRTPYFLGFIIQRPESHLLHHMRGVQAFNYGDVPLWDMLFGTFRNLRSIPQVYGFAEGREQKIFSLIAGKPDAEKRIHRH